MAIETIIIVIGVIIAIIWSAYDYKQKNTIIVDFRGYERNGYGKLIHRIVAFQYIYSYPEYPLRFSDYIVHHIDMNKRNNSLENFQILTSEEHNKIHGFL